MTALALPRSDWALIVAGALLLTLAYPPFHLLVPSFVCLIPAVWLLTSTAEDGRPLRRRLTQGFWYGLIANGVVLHWMVIALWHFTPMSGLGYLATILILAVYTAGLFAVVDWIVTRTRLSLVVVFPMCWTALEWWVGHQGDIRFPWLGLGTSLTGFPVLVQIADLVGARGVTLLLVMGNAMLALAWPRRLEPAARRAAGIVLACVLGALGYGVVRQRTLPTRPVGTIAMVQPNVGFADKWVEERQREIFDDLVVLTHQAVEAYAPQLVIWPEAAVAPSPAQRPSWWHRIEDLAAETGTPIFLGGTDDAWDGTTKTDYWNAAFLIERDGTFGRFPPYHKRYLVPITERVPFVDPRWFNLPFFGGFSIGDRATLFVAGLGPFGVFICYESAFDNLTRWYRRDGADYVVNITNDAWFGRTTAPYQHFAHLVMRAIENRVGIVRAGNSGISGFVDPFGRPYGLTPLGERLYTGGDLRTTDSRTVYVRLGDWVGLLSLVGTAVMMGYAFRRTQ